VIAVLARYTSPTIRLVWQLAGLSLIQSDLVNQSVAEVPKNP